MKKWLSLFVSMFLLLMALGGCSTPDGQPQPAGNDAESPAQADDRGNGDAPSVASDEEEASPAEAETGFVLPSGPVDLPTSGIGTQITTDLKAAGDYTIACIVKNSTNPYMISQLAGVAKAGEDMGFEAITMSPTTGDSVEEQVQIIEDMIQRGVDAIIIHCADSNGIMPGFRKAEEAGIPIITIGTPGSSPTMLRTGVDYEETGYEVAKYLAEQVGGEGKAILLEGPPGAQNAQERQAGILRAFGEYPGIEVLASQTANFKRAEGMSVTENLLQTYTEVDIVIGANDESALGAVQALKAAGMNDVLVGGFDGSVDASSAIQSGEMTVSYNTDPYGSGYVAAAYAVMYLNDGTTPPANFVPFPSAGNNPLITSENIEDYIGNFAWWTAN